LGLKKDYLEYIFECAAHVAGGLSGKKMLELGDQVIMDEAIIEKTGKEYFAKRGVAHISVDLNGLHGSVRADLANPITIPEWINNFDIVTNSGTSEHVEPKLAQYECFKNVHNFLKVGGIAIHLLPDSGELKKGMWENHCRNYYSRGFVEMLVENNDYKLMSLKIIDGLVCFCYRKDKDAIFMEDRQEFLKYIKRMECGVTSKYIDETLIQYLYRLAYRMFHRVMRKMRRK